MAADNTDDVQAAHLNGGVVAEPAITPAQVLTNAGCDPSILQSTVDHGSNKAPIELLGEVKL